MTTSKLGTPYSILGLSLLLGTNDNLIADLEASSTLTLASEADLLLFISASNSVTLSQGVNVISRISIDILSTLSLSASSQSSSTYTRFANNTVSFAQDLYKSGGTTQSVNMARTSKLGTANSILGSSILLGANDTGGTISNLAASNTLALSSTAINISFASASSSLSLTQDASQAGPVPVSASSTITASSVSDFEQSVYARTSISTISISQDLPAPGGTKRIDATNTLVLSEIVGSNQHTGSATTVISGLSTQAEPGLFTLQATSTLALSSDTDSGIESGDAGSVISLTQSADKLTPIISITATTDILSLASVADNNIIEANAESTLVLTQDESVAGPIVTSTDSPVTLTDQSVVNFGAYGRIANNTIQFFGVDPSQVPAYPAPDNDTVTSSIRDLEARNPDQTGGSFPESSVSRFTDLWVQGPYLAQEYVVSASSILGITHSTPQPTGKRSFFASTSINLLHFADNNIKSRSLTTEVVLTQDATVDRTYRAVSTINVTQSAGEGFIPLQASSTIVLDQLARSNPLDRSSTNVLIIGNTALSSITNLSPENIIPVVQGIDVLRPYRLDATSPISGVTDDTFIPPIGPIIPGVPFGITSEAIVGINSVRHPASLINLGSVVAGIHIKVSAIDLVAETTIGFIDTVNISIVADATTTINLQGVVAANKNTKDAGNDLSNLVDNAEFSIDYANLPVPSNLSLKQALGYSLTRDTTRCDYSPFVGGSDSGVVPPRPTLPEIRKPSLPGVRFRLAYPAFDTGDTISFVDLRAPELGNREGINATRINRESQGGSLVIYADPIWPETHTLNMTFNSLSKSQARELLDFIGRWLGQEIGIYDHEGRVWKGIITNPDEAITHDGKNRFAAAIEFEAERVHQLNRVAQTNLGMYISAGQDEALALDSIGVTDQASYTKNPVNSGISSIACSDFSDYTKVPAHPVLSSIGLSGFSTRNSFFYKQATSSVSMDQSPGILELGDFGNLIHNWDAENTHLVADGDPISTWGDLGTSPVTLNATVSKEPTARDSVLNNKRVIEFRHSAGAESMKTFSNIPLWDLVDKTGTLFIVCILRETLSSGNEVILGNNTDKIFFGGSSSSQRPVALQTSEGDVALETPQSVIASGTTQLLVLKRDGNNLSFRRNKNDEDGVVFSTNPTPGNEILYFGGFSGPGNSVDLDMAQVLMYEDALSTENINNIEGLLTAKWGV